mmetsp:Transcript_14648/g.25556  ORF Transcript_14648/g.25556 Transcript_14648/m.25556 type:complete len:251 (+) Transcript_14648:2161-2913(+)
MMSATAGLTAKIAPNILHLDSQFQRVLLNLSQLLDLRTKYFVAVMEWILLRDLSGSAKVFLMVEHVLVREFTLRNFATWMSLTCTTIYWIMSFFFVSVLMARKRTRMRMRKRKKKRAMCTRMGSRHTMHIWQGESLCLAQMALNRAMALKVGLLVRRQTLNRKKKRRNLRKHQTFMLAKSKRCGKRLMASVKPELLGSFGQRRHRSRLARCLRMRYFPQMRLTQSHSRRLLPRFLCYPMLSIISVRNRVL